MQSLPSRQKITQSSKYKINRRQTPEFHGTFPEECIAPQNTPREYDYDRPESWPWKKIPALKNSKLESRPVSQNEVIGGCGRLSVSPNMDFKKIPSEKRLPSIVSVRDWREISPELLKRDPAWNVLCKHCPKIGSHSRRQYFQRIIKWRKGIIDEKEKKKCVTCDIQKATSCPMHPEQNVHSGYRGVASRLSYSRDYYNKLSRNGKESCRANFSPEIQLSRKKDVQEKIKYTQTPAPPPVSSIAQNPALPVGILSAVGTPESEYLAGKVARYLQMYMPPKKGIHSKCRPLDKIFEPACIHMTDPLRLVYKRKELPGVLQRKTQAKGHESKIKKDRQDFKCDVGKLGLVINLPEYNSNVGKRHVSIPRNTNFVRSCENQKKLKSLQINRTPSVPLFPTFPRYIKPL